MKTEDLVDVESTPRRRIRRLIWLRLREGYCEGFSDAGVAFDAANLMLARFVGDAWPENGGRVVEKMRHILSGQNSCGLFRLYPDGPASATLSRT